MTAGLAIGRGSESFQHTVCNFATRIKTLVGFDDLNKYCGMMAVVVLIAKQNAQQAE